LLCVSVDRLQAIVRGTESLFLSEEAEEQQQQQEQADAADASLEQGTDLLLLLLLRVCVYLYVCMRARARVCVCVCVCVLATLRHHFDSATNRFYVRCATHGSLNLCVSVILSHSLSPPLSLSLPLSASHSFLPPPPLQPKALRSPSTAPTTCKRRRPWPAASTPHDPTAAMSHRRPQQVIFVDSLTHTPTHCHTHIHTHPPTHPHIYTLTHIDAHTHTYTPTLVHFYD
jgi:hypothetical protein